MPHKKHKPEEIVAKLRQVDVLVSQGRSVAEGVRSIGFTEFTYCRWRKEYGGLKIDQVKRLKELERENERLRTAAEDLADLQNYDRSRAALAGGADELIPADYANQLLDGENPLRVYRDLHGLTQAMLAEKAGINRVTVAKIETGRKQGSVASLRAIAVALDVTLDDLPR